MNSQEAAIKGLLDSCREDSIFLSPNIAAQRFPGRGLGIYALNLIKKGDRLIHVPTKAMLTVNKIPETFLSKTVRKKFTVHCALAAYLAFGKDEDLERYRRWMATWPRLEEFTDTMPVFWGQDFRKNLSSGGIEPIAAVDEANGHDKQRQRKRRKTVSGEDDDGTEETNSQEHHLPRFSRSPGVDEHWLTIPSVTSSGTATSVASVQGQPATGHLASQASKIRACIDTIADVFPNLKIRSIHSHHHYLRFLHMWSCVNTRCFYYLRPGQAPPQDSNEAMALCPYQDLFNHSDKPGCTGIFDQNGFIVRADKDHAVGEELFLKYGDHDNDMLWMEYGFMMNRNEDDHVKLDRVVFADPAFDHEKLSMLEKEGYKGQFILKSTGVCYRTIVVSYLGLLDDRQWRRMISGGLDPETNTRYASTKRLAKQRIRTWVRKLQDEAKANMKVLSELEETDLAALFVWAVSYKQGEFALISSEHSAAKKRQELCIRRWIEINDLCVNALYCINGDISALQHDESCEESV